MITSFQGKYRFLSNFHPCKISYMGVLYPSVEHAYQAAKTYNHAQRLAIASCTTAGKAKRMGRTVTMRLDWHSVKTQIMGDLVRKKFSQEPLRTMLLNTGDQVLIEGNAWGDRYWGMVLVNGEWQGQNRLGMILVSVRKELREENNHG